MGNILEVDGLTKRFGALVAIDDLSFSVAEGEVLGIMGPNGAGKSTLFNLIMGKHAPTSGDIRFAGKSIAGAKISEICRLGIGRTYQIPQPFRRMTVLENLMVGKLYGHESRHVRAAREAASEILETTGLADKADKEAGALGLLDLKRLELARALSTSPRLLLLDEIAGGLVEQEVDALEAIIDGLRQRGQSMIVIEHVLRTLFGHSDRVLVLNFGARVTDDVPEDIVKHQEVIDIYLGGTEIAPPDPDKARPAPEAGAMPVLAARGIDAGYGAFQALFDVSLEVYPGEIVALIGMNGAGKTTLTRAITNQIPLMAGEVDWKGVSIAQVPTHKVVDLGIAQCLEGRKIFGQMTVEENLEVGALPHHARPHRAEMLEEIYALFPRLRERRHQLGGTLSGGEQQMLAIGRALMAKPELVIFDEVSLGLAPRIIAQIYEAIPRIAASGITILLIEQSAQRSLAVADRAYILERGRIVMSGDAAEMRADKAVQEAYFGVDAKAG
ncbi:MAG: ATP-binding cassette domain-containing protein [Maritimibacter sp.]|nr:ATP-binding cassette domain-containing protein [Maritimibacter sp.]